VRKFIFIRITPRQKTVLGRVPRSCSGTVAGLRRAALSGRPYPGAIIDTSASSLDGLLLLDITEEERDLIDRFEGDEYVRRGTSVSLTTGDVVEGNVYVYEGELSGDEWSYEAWRETQLPVFVASCRSWREGLVPRHVSGLWLGEALPHASLMNDVPTNPIRWALSLCAQGAALSAFGAGFFDDSGDVPGQPVLLYVLSGSWEPPKSLGGGADAVSGSQEFAYPLTDAGTSSSAGRHHSGEAIRVA
jgi:gamma-glutamylcyclotransferase (GGCT)/AIG2-like uncharacterized protein YtfP